MNTRAEDAGQIADLKEELAKPKKLLISQSDFENIHRAFTDFDFDDDDDDEGLVDYVEEAIQKSKWYGKRFEKYDSDDESLLNPAWPAALRFDPGAAMGARASLWKASSIRLAAGGVAAATPLRLTPALAPQPLHGWLRPARGWIDIDLSTYRPIDLSQQGRGETPDGRRRWRGGRGGKLRSVPRRLI